MKVVQINLSCSFGSTGKICNSISELLSEQGIENYIFYIYGKNPQKRSNYIKFGGFVYTKFQTLKSRILGNYGFNSTLATKLMINKLEKIKPDIVHIHNIHDNNCNFGILFRYFREKNIKVIYTFHDCWAFTGYCPHFTVSKCEKWLNGCGDCSKRKKISWLFDRSAEIFQRKKEALTGQNMIIVTPSQWLADLTKRSFLKEYPVKVINNGIDLEIFKPTESTFRQAYGLQNKKIVLGVSSLWWYPKGFDVFVRLANELPQDYSIVLVGTNESVDKELPKNIISIHRTQNQQELAEIYSAADVFVNPTREDSFPTVNIESIACGTPVITFKTGGSPEIIDDTCGSVVDCDDIDALKKEITRICTEKPYTKGDCVIKSSEFAHNQRYKEYVELYERMVVARNTGN